MFGKIKYIRTFSTTNCYFQHQHLQSTVYALSTPPGRSAIAVVRITGPACKSIFKSLTNSVKIPKPRYATLRKLYDPKTDKMLDDALVLLFPSPNSYTGEDLLELHLHGGTSVINSVMKAISNLHKSNLPIRLAEKGEFSRRGFQNGRFDLTEVEGINTLIHAETETQRLSALSSMKGETKKLFISWREEIIKNVALLATIIDFGEEHDLEEVHGLCDQVKINIEKLENEIKYYINKVERSQILLDGIKVTLIGPPNAGKSSLLNVLAGDEKAIVSHIAGTTRDSIDVPLDVNGYKVVIGDTAGIRESQDLIESEGIKRAKNKSIVSNINILILPADNLTMDEQFLSHAKKLMQDSTKETFVIVNKCDLINEQQKQQIMIQLSETFDLNNKKIEFVSCTSQEGIETLINDLTSKFKKITLSDESDPVTISQRAKEILKYDVLFGFQEFYRFNEFDDVVLASEALKSSIDGIGKVTGEAIGVEEILDVVFSSFCIGK